MEPKGMTKSSEGTMTAKDMLNNLANDLRSESAQSEQKEGYPLTVLCAFCGSKPFYSCINRETQKPMPFFHVARINDSKAAWQNAAESLPAKLAQDRCEGGDPCWFNQETGYREYCPKHEAIIADKAREAGPAMTPTRALIEAAEAMLAKLDQIEPSVNAMIGVQLARTGWQYDGPNYAQEKAALLAAISSAKTAEDGVETAEEELYYIQDKRSYCGNSCFWWKPDGNGYTCNLNEAWKVSRTKAESMMRHRPDVDVAWPVAVIDAGTARHFDVQKLRDIQPLSR